MNEKDKKEMSVLKISKKPEMLFFGTEPKEAVMRIAKGKFFWKGKEVKDVNKIYERFSEWMSSHGK